MLFIPILVSFPSLVVKLTLISSSHLHEVTMADNSNLDKSNLDNSSNLGYSNLGNGHLDMDPAVRRFLEAHKKQIDSYGQFSDSILTDSNKVIKSIIQDVKDIRRKSITALKKDVDFVYHGVSSKGKGSGN